MPLEATIIIIDNSKHSRNGDIIPSRFDAQVDAINLVADAKLDENQESVVGLMTMGNRVDNLVSLVREKQPILGAISGIQIGGDCQFVNAIQIAKLSLKHRANKNQRQRLCIMVASPIQESQAKLVALGRTLKRDNIALNILNLGETSNIEKLKALVDTVNNEQNSIFMNVDSGISLLSDMLYGSPFLGGSGQNGGMEQAGDMDEELEMILRISLEEEQRRLDATRIAAQNQPNPTTTEPQNFATQTQTQAQQAPEISREEQDLIDKAQALTLSDHDNADTQREETELIDNPDFLGEIMAELDIDPEDDFVKNLVSNNTHKKDSKEERKDDQEKKD